MGHRNRYRVEQGLQGWESPHQLVVEHGELGAD